jgi:hypothetical protein
MNWLEYFLAAPSALPKKPFLVLIVRADIGSREPKADEILAAVLMFEYRLLGLPTRIFSTDDISGFRTVLAPPGHRAAAAAMAANAVLDHGAHFALITYSDANADTGAPMLTKGGHVQWARQVRAVAKTLPLAADFEETLATLGKATRFNLRYYRRRLVNRLRASLSATHGAF